LGNVWNYHHCCAFKADEFTTELSGVLLGVRGVVFLQEFVVDKPVFSNISGQVVVVIGVFNRVVGMVNHPSKRLRVLEEICPPANPYERYEMPTAIAVWNT